MLRSLLSNVPEGEEERLRHRYQRAMDSQALYSLKSSATASTSIARAATAFKARSCALKDEQGSRDVPSFRSTCWSPR